MGSLPLISLGVGSGPVPAAHAVMLLLYLPAVGTVSPKAGFTFSEAVRGNQTHLLWLLNTCHVGVVGSCLEIVP